jgi:hypothetical protein
MQAEETGKKGEANRKEEEKFGKEWRAKETKGDN